METAAYLRVSTTNQTPRPQRRGIERYAARADLNVAEWYIDEGVSGRTEDRPALGNLMSAVREGRFGCVLVWKFDRFARSVSHLVRALDEFNTLGVRFASVRDQVDTASPMGKAMFTIIGAMAELESSLISERVKAGMEAARAEGKHVGRPATSPDVVAEIERLARETDLSVRKIKAQVEASVSRGVVGRVVKRVRSDKK